MKKIVMLMLVAFFTLPALAQSVARPKPAGLEPVADVPPPPEIKADSAKEIAKLDTSPDTKVTVTKRGDERIEEFRFKGKHYKSKVTPAKGPSYYLVDPKGDGSFVRHDGPDLKMAVPMWVLLEW